MRSQSQIRNDKYIMMQSADLGAYVTAKQNDKFCDKN